MGRAFDFRDDFHREIGTEEVTFGGLDVELSCNMIATMMGRAHD